MPDFSIAGRGAALDAASRGVDVVVVGGGVTGAGVALEAASRGLRTVVLERDDFGSGTSSKSSKLIHGGLRYLQQHDFLLVYEALFERQRLLGMAPHLVRPLPFLIPLFGSNRAVARGINWALTLYDLTGAYRIGKLHRRIGLDETLELMPSLRTDRLTAGFLYYDAQVDDARLTVTALRTAALRYGAAVANHCEVVRFEKDSAGDVRAVVAMDVLGGGDVEIPCKVVVNAAGVWVDVVRALDEGAEPDTIRPAKGVHLVIPRRFVGNAVAAVLPVPKDRRSIFVIPWADDLTIVGTTDTDYAGDVERPEATESDVAYLLSALNTWVTTPVRPEDVIATYAGLRPLVKAERDGRTADLSRRHRVETSRSGVITVSGGKLTTWRRMGVDAMTAVRRLLLAEMGTSVSSQIPLDGAADLRDAEAAAVAAGMPVATARHLARRYGAHAAAVASLAASDPSLGLPLVPGLPYLRAEVVWHARHEMAATVSDVLERRTRVVMEHASRGLDAAASVASLLAAELGHDRSWQEAEVAEYHRRVEYRRESEGLDSLSQGLSTPPVPDPGAGAPRHASRS